MIEKRGLSAASTLGLWALLTVAPLQAVDEFPSRVSHVEGSAAVAFEEELEWLELIRNMPVRAGDRLVLQRDALVELELNDGSFLRLAGESDLTVREFGPERFVFLLAAGEMILRVESERYFEVETLSLEFRPAEPGVYRFGADTAGFAKAVVRAGSLHVRSGEQSLLLARGEAVEVAGETDRLASIGHDFVRDRFDYWSDARDAREAGLRESPLAEYDVAAGVSDLNRYGSWGYDSHYGRIWWPHVGASWAPYRLGSWLYYPSFGWTWISHEPWGWLPYHSGRWVFVTSYGRWCWVPGSFRRWYPSTAHFYHGRGRVAWRPAAPGEEIVTRRPHLTPEEAARPTPSRTTVVTRGEGWRGWTVVQEDAFLAGRTVPVRNPPAGGDSILRDLRPGLPEAPGERVAEGRLERARSGWTSTGPVVVRVGSGGTRVLRTPESGADSSGENVSGRDPRVLGAGSSRVGEGFERGRTGRIIRTPNPEGGRDVESRGTRERITIPATRRGPAVRSGSEGGEPPAVRRGRSSEGAAPTIRPPAGAGPRIRPERTTPGGSSGSVERPRPRPRSSVSIPSSGGVSVGGASEVRRSPAVRSGGVRVGPGAASRQQERRQNRPSP